MTMFTQVRLVFMTVLVFAVAISVTAQVGADRGAGRSGVTSDAAAPPDHAEADYKLKKGDNELGFWGGGAFQATTIFGGLRKDEAADRRFLIAAFRYGRTLAANDSMALQYTLDAIPLAVATGDIVQIITVGPVTTFRRETAYGAGLTPLGLQLDFANSSKVHPFIHVNGGALIFNKPMPLPDSGKFAFVGETGAGVRIFTSEKRAVTLGVRFHHISNGNLAGSNRGLNQFIVYGGFSVFK